MGLFQKVFGKESCTLCGNECGMMHRTKIKGGEYVCSDCVRQCSKYVRISEMDKQQVAGHIEYMKRQEKLYEELFVNAKRDTYPSPVTKQGISFADELGMFTIVERSDPQNKVNHELFRYDQVASYERYVETEKAAEAGKPDVFKERGVKIRLLNKFDNVSMDMDKAKKGLRPHPYIRQEIKVVFSTSERDTDYTDNAVYHFDHIFGVHDNESALFSFKGSKNQQREFKAQVDIAKTALGAFKAIKNGTLNEENEALKEQFGEMQQSTAEAQTGGMSIYTQRADEAEEKVNG